MKSKKENAFSEKLERLETIYNTIKTLDAENLEHLIELYEEGMLLSKSLQESLISFELKVTEISKHAQTTYSKQGEDSEHLISLQEIDIKDTTSDELEVIQDLSSQESDVSTNARNKSTSSRTVGHSPQMQKYATDLFADLDNSE